MDQISRPVLIALVAAVAFAGAWMTVLKPKAEGGGDAEAAAPIAAATQPAVAPESQTGLGRTVDKAKGAVAASESSAKAVESATAEAPKPASPAKTAPPKAEVPKPAKKPAPAEPRAAKPATGRTILLFAGSGADDQVARDVVARSSRPGVKVIVASLADVGDYKDLLGSISVVGSPTILVVGPDHKAQRIEGLPDAAQVEQALKAVR